MRASTTTVRRDCETHDPSRAGASWSRHTLVCSGPARDAVDRHAAVGLSQQRLDECGSVSGKVRRVRPGRLCRAAAASNAAVDRPRRASGVTAKIEASACVRAWCPLRYRCATSRRIPTPLAPSRGKSPIAFQGGSNCLRLRGGLVRMWSLAAGRLQLRVAAHIDVIRSSAFCCRPARQISAWTQD